MFLIRPLSAMIFLILLALLPEAAYTAGKPAEGGNLFVKKVFEIIDQKGKQARFDSFIVKGGRTEPVSIQGAKRDLKYKVVAFPGHFLDEFEAQNSQNFAWYEEKNSEYRDAKVMGIEYGNEGTSNEKTVLYLYIPDSYGYLWPAAVFCIAAYVDDEQFLLQNPYFVSVVQTRVSNPATARFLAIALVAFFYLLAALGVRTMRLKQFEGATKSPEYDLIKTLDPIQMTSGIFGRSSLSNLQIFSFTLIIVGLLIYVLLLTGKLTDISANVAWLLGIVGVGTGAARMSASTRRQLESPNLRWILNRKWGVTEPCLSQLVTQGGEFSISRFQGIAFGFVVGISLIISGPSDLAGFTIPDTILGLLVASQAIYVGGKWVQPGSKEQKEEMQDINKTIREAREAEEELIKAIPAGTPHAQLKAVAMQQKEFTKYREKAGKAANLFAAYLDIEMPTTGVYGVSLVYEEQASEKGGQ